MFKEVDSRKKLPEVEQEILTFWEQKNIFDKSLELRKDAERYTFYDGPPFATGLPHYGHIVASVLKDVVPRYWAMRGKYVERRWGWDCHGLPIENIVEKELGTIHKKDIEKLGVDKFNELCRSKVLEYAGEWEKIIPRIGRWADMKNAYRTMDKDFMESVWWVFKQIYDKGLVYEDYRSMHICPRCETTLSQSEVAEGYKMIKDLSVTVTLALVDEPGTSLLAWTTTPWTLPGNVAVAVHPEMIYVRVASGDEKYICAKSLVESVFGEKEYTIEAEFPGTELVGKAYKPLWNYYAKDATLENHAQGWKVYAADFITQDSGTGIAHEAPAFGADDMALGKEENWPFIQHVRMDGTIKDAVVDFAGLNVKPIDDHQATDIAIIKNLAHNNLLFSKEKYEHSYPHCWRCDTPLLNYATSSWFVAVTKIKEQLLADAEDIHWSPEHIKAGRWGKWLDGARDWSISRQRFWASVMPVWRCDKECDAEEVFGSAADLEKRSGQKIDDLHKHVVDEVTFACASDKCDGTMIRIPDVLDTWFDSGSMPYGQAHYPFEDQKQFEHTFPADFIAEGVDQTRAWFYYLHVLAGAVFGKRAFNNVIVNGIVLAEDGKKMSKKLQNYPDPMEIVGKYGADPLRLYLAQSPVISVENINFSEQDLAELSRNTFRMLWQSYSFFTLYANVDAWTPAEKYVQSKNILDQWIVSQLHVIIAGVNEHMEKYEMMQAARLFNPFIDDLSNWYIRRSRKRFWKSDDDGDKNDAYATLHYVLIELSKTMAPFTPFIADEIYKNLSGDTNEESVHLVDFPQAEKTFINKDLNTQMTAVREVITAGLKLRAQASMKVRQPLQSLTTSNAQLTEEFFDIVIEEVNVKEILVDKNLTAEGGVALDTELTEELTLEGQARELIRHIQSMRKEAGYNVDDHIILSYDDFGGIFAVHGELIAAEVLADDVQKSTRDAADLAKEISVDDLTGTIGVTKA